MLGLKLSPRRSVGPSEGRCLQLLDGIVGSEWLGTAISAKDVAFAPPGNCSTNLIWVIAVALPLWSAFRSIELTRIMAMGTVVDLIVIPWAYVIANYVKKPGDR